MIAFLKNISNDKVALLLFIAYCIFLIYTIIRIVIDTHSTSKTLAYLLVVMLFPVLGIILYYSFGLNIRQGISNKRIGKIYKEISTEYDSLVQDQTDKFLSDQRGMLGQYTSLVQFLKNLGNENLTSNRFKLLINGEEKFPEVIKSLHQAKHHIHMEYYAWENDIRGNQVKDILLQKASQGVKVRAIYDAYASRKIRHNIVKELRQGGVEVFPVIKVKLVRFANRINHRDHRKMIIIDGKIGFVGGINLSDRYDNSIETGLYWRDTHLKITGPGVMNLQRHFMVNWNASQPVHLPFSEIFSANEKPVSEKGQPGLSQIISGGPIYPMANIMLAYSRLFTLAKEKLYITNPYFIPNETILDALKQAAKSGVDVRLMLPKKSDSAIVSAASKFYYNELLSAGVRIFLYQKGFVHAKTVLADGMVSIIGTANMDIRSFDLNFEVMAIIFGKEMAKQMEDMFTNDLLECIEADGKTWANNTVLRKLIYSIARLISSLL